MVNKKGFVFRDAFFAIIVGSMIFIAVGTWIADWNIKYDSGLDYDLDRYNELSSVSDSARGQQGNISVEGSFDVADFEGTSIKGVFRILNNIFEPFRIIFGNNGVIDSVTERWGLPDWVRQSLVTIMVLSITFALIAILFKRQESKV